MWALEEMHAKERVDVPGPRSNELLVNAQDPYHTLPILLYRRLRFIASDHSGRKDSPFFS